MHHASAQIAASPAAVIDRAALSAAVAVATDVVERRCTIPILANLHLEAAGGDSLYIKGTDLDMELCVRVPGAAIDPRFATTVPAHHLKDMLKKAKASDAVAITAQNPDEDVFDAGLDFAGLRIKLKALAPFDFPHLDGPATPHRFTMPTASLNEALARVEGAISTEETRYYLNGVYMHAENNWRNGRNELRFVATDGHRLSLYCADLPVMKTGMPGVILPAKAVKLLRKIMKGRGVADSVKVEVSTHRVRFTFGNVMLTTKTIDGTFPDYQRVIPTGNEKRAVFNRADLSAAVENVLVISSIKGRAVRFEFHSGKVTLTVNDPDAGSATTDLPVTLTKDGVECEPMEIGFNGAYVRAVMSWFDSEEAEFELQDASSPAVIRPAGDDRHLMVLMPLRV